MTRKEKQEFASSVWMAATHEVGRAMGGMEPLTFDEWFSKRFPIKNKNNLKGN